MDAPFAWMGPTATLAFGVAAVFAGALRLPRDLFLVPYVGLVGAAIVGWAASSRVRILESIRRHWALGVAGGIAAGVFGVYAVYLSPPSSASTGLALVRDVLWLGVVYGTIDALALVVLPLGATWSALATLGWTRRASGKIATGTLALLASLAMIFVYHVGYPEYRGPVVATIVLGVGMQSLVTLLARNPLPAVLAHVAMHVAAVLHGPENVLQLPPHY